MASLTDLANVSQSLNERMSKLMEDLEGENRKMRSEQSRLFDMLSKRSEEEEGKKDQPRYIFSLSREGQYHWVAPYDLTCMALWVTKCGWSHGYSAFERCHAVPPGVSFRRICKRCLSKLRSKREMEQTSKKADPGTQDDGSASAASSSSSCSSCSDS